MDVSDHLFSQKRAGGRNFRKKISVNVSKDLVDKVIVLAAGKLEGVCTNPISKPIFPDLPTDDGVARRNVLMSIPTIPPDLSIDLTASIVSCQSCVVYTTFVGNSVLSFTTSKLNY